MSIEEIEQQLKLIEGNGQKDSGPSLDYIQNQLDLIAVKDVEGAADREEILMAQRLKRTPTTTYAVGGEPEVRGDEDILAKEEGQTATFMEPQMGEGKPVEVRRAQAVGVTGELIPEPISPDGFTFEERTRRIKAKQDELVNSRKLPFSEYMALDRQLTGELQGLRKAQSQHEGKYRNWLKSLVTQKEGQAVEIESGLGEEVALGVTEGKKEVIPIQTRTQAAYDFARKNRQFVDDIIGNDKFIAYAQQNLGVGEPAKTGFFEDKVGPREDFINKLRKDPRVRREAEKWAMTTPEFMEQAGSVFKAAWDGYASTIGSSSVGAIGLALQGMGLEGAGGSLVELAELADQERERTQDPRKLGSVAQFAKDVSSGVGTTAAFIAVPLLGRTASARLGVTSEKAIDILQKANTLSFSGLASAWGGYSEARRDGATEDQAKDAALFSAMTQAPIELVSPLQKWVKRLDPNSQSRIYNGMMRGAQAVIEGGEEALLNELPQTIAGNIVKKYVYNPNQDIFEDAQYSAEVGGAAGLLTSIFTQMVAGRRAKAKRDKGDVEGAEQGDIEFQANQEADQLAPTPETAAAMQMMEISSSIDTLRESIESDKEAIQGFEEGSSDYTGLSLSIKEKEAELANLEKRLSEIGSAQQAPVGEKKVEEKPGVTTREQIETRLQELDKEFGAVAEDDVAGQDRINKEIFGLQNQLAQMTAIEQGVEPQGTTPTRQPQPAPSGRATEFGTFYPERPILQAFMKATDKAISSIKSTSKRGQQLKNAIRSAVAKNAGFLAGTNTKVITSQEYDQLTGRESVAADSGTYRAVMLGDQKYLVIPNTDQLAGETIRGEEQAATRDNALDQEARAASKKLEEEMIHLAMFQGIQDEYKGLKKPTLSLQEYAVKRINQIYQEVDRTNPDVLPGVSEVYLGKKGKLDPTTASMEFMRMVVQRVRTGQITEDLNAIRQAEKETFSDKDRGGIISLKNSILNALKFLRNGIARYLGKGTSTKEVKRMENAINNILDEYGIVKGEANYEFKDYSAAQPKEELKTAPAEEASPVTPAATTEATPTPAVSETITASVEDSPNTEVESEVSDIESLPDDSTYEQIELAAPATMVNLKASIKNVAGSFQQFTKILGDSFKSLVRFAQTIWKKIGFLTTAIAGVSAIASPIFVADFNNLQGPEGRADLRPTGLIKGNQNIFKPYLKKINVEELTKSLETPAETLDLIRNAINQAQPFVGNVDIDFNSIDQFADSINPGEFPSGNTKRSYNYNPLLEISADDIKNAAQSLKALAKDKAKIESRIRQIMGAMEFFTKRKFKDVKIIIRQTSPSEAATFMALGRAGGFPTSRAQYNPKENTIELQPQTLISLAEDGVVATSSASNIANELTHNLQFTTNNGQPLGILGIKLSDFDTASTFLAMQMPIYSQNGKFFQTINAESDWADILIGKYFGAKNNIQPKSIESVIAEQPKVQKALQEKETTDFIDSIVDMSGISSQEIIARAGTTPISETITPIEAKAGVTPQMDAEYLDAVERGDMETAQRMVDEAAKKSVSPLGEKWSEDGVVSEVIETFNWLNEDRVDPNVFRYSLGVERAVKQGESIWSYLDRQMLPFFEMDMGMEREDLVKWFLAQNEKIDSIGSGESEVDIPPIYGTNERGRTLIRGVEAYAKLRRISTDPVTFDDAGNVIPLSQRFDVTTPIIARAGVTPEAQYFEAIKGDNGSDIITPKTNQETWENNNPESASKINSLILQRLKEVGHLWKGSVKMPMFKAASKDFKSAGGDVGSFFAETKEHAMSYLERGKKIFSAYIKMDNPANSSDVVRVLSKAFPQYAEEFRSDEGDWGSVMSTGGISDGAKFVKAMQDAGYDGIYQWDGVDRVAVVFNPNQAKSADLVTFDKKGQVIPLSQRFDVTSPLIARAGKTPEAPKQTREQKVMARITEETIAGINESIQALAPKRDRSGKEYVSRTTLKGKTYPNAILSPHSIGVTLYTMSATEAGAKALEKALSRNPGKDIYSIAQDIVDTNEASLGREYNLKPEEQYVLAKLLLTQFPVILDKIKNSTMSLDRRTQISLEGRTIQGKLTRKVAEGAASGGRVVQYSNTLRQIGNAGAAILTYKNEITNLTGKLWTQIEGSFNDIANAVRGDRRKSMDNLMNVKKVFQQTLSMVKQANKNPEKVRQAIRKQISRKQNESTRKILLDFCAAQFGTDSDKYANMMVKQTADYLLAIGMDKKGFSIQDVEKFMYQAFTQAAKSKALEIERAKRPELRQPKKAQRKGKYLEIVKAVIGNDTAYKEFLKNLAAGIRSRYQNETGFQEDFGELFTQLRSNEWSEGLRQQAIKDSAEFLDYKFRDLFGYLGEQRNVKQENVKQHMRMELAPIGASNELIEKFITDVDAYLAEQTEEAMKNALGLMKVPRNAVESISRTGGIATISTKKNHGFKTGDKISVESKDNPSFKAEGVEVTVIDENTFTYKNEGENVESMKDPSGKVGEFGVRPTKLMQEKIKEEAEAQFKLVKGVKDIVKLSSTDEGNFKEGLVSRLITEIGMPEAESAALADYLITELNKATAAQRSQNTKDAIAKAEAILKGEKKIIKKAGRSFLQKIIEQANSGQLDSHLVYQALKESHQLPKNFPEYSADFVNQLREWGDRISKLPEGVIRAIEEEKMARALQEKHQFTAGGLLSAYWYYALLSQVATPTINVLAGVTNLFSNMAIWSAQTKFKSGFPMLRAMYKAMEGKSSPAVNAYLYVMQTGLNPSGIMDANRQTYPKAQAFETGSPDNMPKLVYYLSTFGDGKLNFLPDWLNNGIRAFSPRYFMRRLRATDYFLREVAFEVKAQQLGAARFESRGYELAINQARGELVSSEATGKELEREVIIRANEIYRKQRIQDEKTMASVEESARETVYGQEPQGVLGDMARFVNSQLQKRPATQLIIPFSNTVANVTNELLNYLGFGIYRAGKEEFTLGRKDKETELLIKGYVGFAALIIPLVIQSFQSGDEEDKEGRPVVQIYSEGPRDPGQNALWRERGGIKYSIRINDTYYSLLATPLVLPLVVAANTAEEIQRLKKKAGGDILEALKEDPSDSVKTLISVASAPVGIALQATLNQSFLTGLADLFEVKDSKSAGEWTEGFAKNIVSRLITPGSLRDLNKLLTDNRAAGKGYLSNYLKEFPVVSEYIGDEVGYFGEDVKYPSALKEDGVGRRAFSLLGRLVSTEKPDPVFELIYEKGIELPSWINSYEWPTGIPMKKSEQQDFRRLAGPLMREEILNRADEIKEMDRDEAEETVKSIIQSTRSSVKMDMLLQNERVMRMIENKQL